MTSGDADAVVATGSAGATATNSFDVATSTGSANVAEAATKSAGKAGDAVEAVAVFVGDAD